MKTNYVLVDYENRQPNDFDVLKDGPFRIKVFLGAHQNKLPRDLVKSLQAFGERAEYVDLDVQGKNALDFHIAYAIGRIVAEDREAYIHVITRDKDIELLFPHLQAQGVHIGRCEELADIPLLKRPPASDAERLQRVVDHLDRIAGKPSNLRALEATIGSVFRKALPPQDVTRLVSMLEDGGYARVLQDNSIEYGLPLA